MNHSKKRNARAADISIAQVRERVSQLYKTLSDQFAPGRVARNGMFGVAQSVTVTICFFFVYKLVVSTVGVNRLGVWTLLVAGSALVRVGDISGGGALARFIPISVKQNDEYIRNTIHTVILTSVVLNCILAIGFSISARFLLPMLIDVKYLDEAQALVPWVVVVMVLSGLAVATAAGIDGAQRADHRAGVMMFSAAIFLLVSLVLIPSYGVVGFGAAQVAQQLAMCLASWVVLRHHVPNIGWFPRYWRKNVFIETTAYGLKLNAIGVVGLLFEPLVKFALNSSGGPGTVALYELASRLVYQFRALVISAATPLVPTFAIRVATENGSFQRTLEKISIISAYASVGVFVVIIVSAPIVSIFVLKMISADLLRLCATLGLGWSIQLICLAFYFAGQGAGVLRWNIMGQVTLLIATLVGSVTSIFIPSTNIVVASICIGLMLSTIITIIGNASTLGVLDVAYRLRWRMILNTLVIATIYLIDVALVRML